MQDSVVIRQIQSEIGGTPHVCTNQCQVSQINVHIHEKDGFHIRWSGNNQPWMDKSTFRRALQYVYVCESTGTVHHCTDDCTLEPISNDDHTLVCPVSGVQWNNEAEVVRSWKLTSKCVPSITADKRDPNMYSRAADGTVGGHTLNIKNEECKQEVKKFLEIFVTSHARKTQELEKYKQNYASAIKMANKFIKHSKKDGLLNACTLQNIITTETYAKPIFLRVMRFYVDRLDALAEEISPIILNIWNLVIVPRQIAFSLFVPAVLFLLQRGIAVDSVVLVEKNHLLDRILPDANTLHDFRVNKSNFTATKNTIRAAIRALLKKHTLEQIREMIN